VKKLNCILLVDDDITTNFLNESLIEEIGITKQVLVAQNGKEGIEMVERYFQEQAACPQLILLDINMPVMDGFEFLEAFQKLDFEHKDSIVIIILTTSLNPIDVHKVKELGVSGFLSKPLTEEILNEILNSGKIYPFSKS
jgi:CheY-like chemotaxis protein